MATMATQQRSVIITAIVLAIILGGVLVWLLNRTPADQLTTQAPEATATPEEVSQTQPTEIPVETVTPESVQGVAATAPTGAGTVGLASALSGLGGLGVISLAFFRRLRR